MKRRGLILSLIAVLVALQLHFNYERDSQLCEAQASDTLRAQVYSPNGLVEAYSRISHDVSVFCLTTTDGENKSVLKRFELPGFVSEASWSPDGKHLVFEWDSGARGDIVTNTELYLMDSETLMVKNITNAMGSINTDAHWSPDSKYIAFMTDGNNGDFDIAVYVVQYDHMIPRAGREGTDAVQGWTKDGKIVVYNNLSNETYCLEVNIPEPNV